MVCIELCELHELLWQNRWDFLWTWLNDIEMEMDAVGRCLSSKNWIQTALSAFELKSKWICFAFKWNEKTKGISALRLKTKWMRFAWCKYFLLWSLSPTAKATLDHGWHLLLHCICVCIYIHICVWVYICICLCICVCVLHHQQLVGEKTGVIVIRRAMSVVWLSRSAQGQD